LKASSLKTAGAWSIKETPEGALDLKKRSLGQTVLRLMEEMGGPVPVGATQKGLRHDP